MIVKHTIILLSILITFYCPELKAEDTRHEAYFLNKASEPVHLILIYTDVSGIYRVEYDILEPFVKKTVTVGDKGLHYSATNADFSSIWTGRGTFNIRERAKGQPVLYRGRQIAYSELQRGMEYVKNYPCRLFVLYDFEEERELPANERTVTFTDDNILMKDDEALDYLFNANCYALDANDYKKFPWGENMDVVKRVERLRPLYESLSETPPVLFYRKTYREPINFNLFRAKSFIEDYIETPIEILLSPELSSAPVQIEKLAIFFFNNGLTLVTIINRYGSDPTSIYKAFQDFHLTTDWLDIDRMTIQVHDEYNRSVQTENGHIICEITRDENSCSIVKFFLTHPDRDVWKTFEAYQKVMARPQ